MASPAGKTVSALLIFFAVNRAAPAKQIDCWVDIFNGPEFSGKQERIYGPSELPRLRNLAGFDWNDVIESVEVGTGAEVTVYRDENFVVPKGPLYHAPELKEWNYEDENYRSGVMTFSQGQLVHHLGEYQLHRQISSLTVKCKHPRQPSSEDRIRP